MVRIEQIRLFSSELPGRLCDSETRGPVRASVPGLFVFGNYSNELQQPLLEEKQAKGLSRRDFAISRLVYVAATEWVSCRSSKQT